MIPVLCAIRFTLEEPGSCVCMHIMGCADHRLAWSAGRTVAKMAAQARKRAPRWGARPLICPLWSLVTPADLSCNVRIRDPRSAANHQPAILVGCRSPRAVRTRTGHGAARQSEAAKDTTTGRKRTGSADLDFILFSCLLVSANQEETQ